MRRLLLALAGSVVVLGPCGPAAGQDERPTFGPPTPGVCLFTQADALARSKAGTSADQQLRQFANGADAELNAQHSAILYDDHMLAGQKGQMPQAEYDARTAQLKQRYAELDRTRTIRQAQLEATRSAAAAQVMAVLQPSLAEAITIHRCSFVLEKSVTYAASDAMDITGAVIERMDARLSFVPLSMAPPPAGR